MDPIAQKRKIQQPPADRGVSGGIEPDGLTLADADFIIMP
jgi:hypothetical protein